MKKTADLTNNEYYGGINRRFDRRAARLRSLGFRYERIEELGIGVFWRGFSDQHKKNTTLPASFVAHTDRRAFNDFLKRVLTY